jgi:ATP-dependent protease ClpP protease subunit
MNQWVEVLKRSPLDFRPMRLAASAASVIAMAGGDVFMSPVSMLMIHNVRPDRAFLKVA